MVQAVPALARHRRPSHLTALHLLRSQNGHLRRPQKRLLVGASPTAKAAASANPKEEPPPLQAPTFGDGSEPYTWKKVFHPCQRKHPRSRPTSGGFVACGGGELDEARTQDDSRNVFQEGTHWICGVCGEENSIQRNVCNSPYCKGVRLRDSVLTRYAPTEPGSSSSAGQEEGAPPKSSAGRPKPAYKEPPDTSCQSRPTGGQPKPVYKVPPSQGKGEAEKKTKPPPLGLSGLLTRRLACEKRTGGNQEPEEIPRRPQQHRHAQKAFQPVSSPSQKLLRPRPTSYQGATARSLSPPTTRLRRPPAKLGPKGSARPPTPLHPILEAAPAVAPKMAPQQSLCLGPRRSLLRRNTSASYNWGYPPSWPAPPSLENRRGPKGSQGRRRRGRG